MNLHPKLVCDVSLSILAYTSLNVLNLYHENILIRGGIQHQTIQKDVRFQPYLTWGQLLRLLQTTQVCMEMLMRRKWSDEKKIWLGIFGIEAIKCLIRLWVIYSSRNHMMIEYQALPSEMQLKVEQQDSEADKDQKFRSTFQSLEQEENPIGKRSGKAMPTFDYRVPFVQKREKLYIYQPMTTSFMTGEILNAVRPVMYSLIVYKMGKDAWTPWLASAVTDFVSLQFSKMDGMSRGVSAKDEIFRRQGQMFYYLFKSPFFDVSFKPGLQWFDEKVKWVPLLGGIVSNIMEYMLVLQTYHFYTSN